MSQFLFRLGRTTASHPFRTIGVWLLIALAVFAWNGSAGGDPINDYRVPGVESQEAADTLDDQFPDFAGTTGPALCRPSRRAPTRHSVRTPVRASSSSAPVSTKATNGFQRRSRAWNFAIARSRPISIES